MAYAVDYFIMTGEQSLDDFRHVALREIRAYFGESNAAVEGSTD
jgi:hypothetical protein